MENIDLTVNNLAEYNHINPHLLWFIFFLLAFYNMIFLLNIMIAIVSESYENACRNEK